MQSFEVFLVREWKDTLADELARLTTQLSNHFGGRDKAFDKRLELVLGSQNAALFIAQEVSTKVIAGCAMVSSVVTPLGPYGIVDHVVVDESARGHGLGKKLMQSIEDHARAQGLNELHLTSKPSRIAARQLYTGLGYELKDTGFL